MSTTPKNGHTELGVEALRRLFNPTTPRREFDWAATEDAVGPVPEDYKQLAAVFGHANFCGGIELYVPHPKPHMAMAWATAEDREFLTDDDNVLLGERPSHTPDGKPFDPATLISWGRGSSGEYWLWYPDPDIPDDPNRYYCLLVTSDQADWWFFTEKTTDLVYQWVTGTTPGVDDYYHVSQLLDGDPPFVDIYDDDGTPTLFTASA